MDNKKNILGVGRIHFIKNIAQIRYMAIKKEFSKKGYGSRLIESLEKIALNISKICEISKSQINIKGKTTEKLGVIGKEQAIACEVITSVIKYD